MALAPMTISQSRSAVIDFSKPYMDLGLGILMQIPGKPDTNIFGFVDPLSREVWFTAFSIMVLVAVISLLLDKVSPNGHYGSVVQAELDEGCDREEVSEECSVFLKRRTKTHQHFVSINSSFSHFFSRLRLKKSLED